MVTNFLSLLNRRIRGMLADPLRGFQLSVILLLSILAAGTLGYMLIESMEVVEALYMTIITVSTVGFGEIKPLSPPGRVFTSVLIILGLASVTGAVSNAASVVLGPRLWLSIRERRMEDLIE